MRSEIAQVFSVPEHYVAVTSTGVIGEHLPMDIIISGIQKLPHIANKTGDVDFSEAILTTDTCTKNVCVEVEIDGKKVTIAGTAKGSGMIHPNMATMLGFITTDASISQPALLQALRNVTNDTFNMITVDGDTSTNDMVVAMASGLAGNTELNEKHPQWSSFLTAFHYICQELAKKIARDGEGATKLIEVHVNGALTKEMASAVGKTIVGSSLVKSAVFGADANWGRIICAVGYSQQPIRPEIVDICLGSIPVVKQGLPIPFNDEEATEYLKNEIVQIFVDLHLGEERAVAWGCDLTYDYVRINASYRT